MAKPNNFFLTLEASEFLVPSATAAHPVGTRYEMADDTATNNALKVFKYVKAHGNLTVKGCYTLTTNATGVMITAAPATNAVPQAFGVANTAVTSGYYFWIQIEGETIVDVVAAGCTTGNTAKLTNGVLTVTDEAGTADTALSVGKFLATSAVAAAVAFALQGNGKRITI